jgi:macrodomain Ter protein organizer (MatP/YcbG family)
MIFLGGDMMKHINNEDKDGLTHTRGGHRKGAGRKPIGTTRKISLTLPQTCWDEIDRYCQRGDYSVSEVLRSIVEDHLHQSDLL